MTGESRVVTWSRWRKLSTPEYSLYRALEYEQIYGMSLPGRTLDLGGGERANYLPLLQVRGEIVSVNLDPGIAPTLLADLNAPFPFREKVFDDVITFNTLEHIYNDLNAITEIVRVLKPGGRFHIGVPFLYRVHGSPDDYHRHTASWWRRTLAGLDVDVSTLRVEPLTWDPLASAFSIVEFNRIRRLLKKPVMFRAVLEAHRSGGAINWQQRFARRNSDFALGYYITGQRSGNDAAPVTAATSREFEHKRASLNAATVRSIARRVADGLPLAERPLRFVVQTIADQHQLATSRRAHDFRHSGMRFSARAADWNGVREVLLDGEYDVVDQLLPGCPNVLDLGANIGMFALRMLTLRPGATVHSYEPDAATFEILLENVRRNPGLAWDAYHAAAHAQTGTVRFASAPTSTAGRVGATGVDVPSVSLADIVNRLGSRRVDLAKIDIEGSEAELLCASPHILSKINAVIVEVHPDLNDAKAVMDTLRKCFPYLARIPERASSKPLVLATHRDLGLPFYS
jgi:FkbM family methyltransferase